MEYINISFCNGFSSSYTETMYLSDSLMISFCSSMVLSELENSAQVMLHPENLVGGW